MLAGTRPTSSRSGGVNLAFFSSFGQGCFSKIVDLKSSLVSFRENVATTIGIYFDGISGNLTFYKDGHNLGVAFTGLHEVLFIT